MLTAPLPQLFPYLDEGLNLLGGGQPKVDKTTVPVGPVVRVPDGTRTEVREVVPECLQVLLAQDLHLLATGTPGNWEGS